MTMHQQSGPTGKNFSKLFLVPLVLAMISAPVLSAADTFVARDLVLQGSNQWIFHTPDDGRTTMYVAPWKSGGWSWRDQFTFQNSGIFTTYGIRTEYVVNRDTKGQNYPIWSSSPWRFYSPGNKTPTIELCGEYGKDVFMKFRSFDRMEYSAGLDNTGTTFQISPGGNISNSAGFKIRWDGSAEINSAGSEPALELFGKTDAATRYMRFHIPNRSWYSIGTTADGHFRICGGANIDSDPILDMTQREINANLNMNAKDIKANNVRAGYVGTARLQVRSDWWADRVFAPDYHLKPLSEVADFIREHQHLPDVPSETEILRDGINGADMFATQMTKIEELTLHAIDLDQRLAKKDAVIDVLQQQNTDLQRQITELRESQARLVQRFDRIVGAP